MELLVLITKYNLAYPTDKIKPQITASVNDRESNMVKDIIAQDAARRAKYPYNSFQRQAQKLQPLLEKVLRLSKFRSYNDFDWMELLIAVNDMLKLVRSKMQETQKINSERIKKELERRKAEYSEEKIRRAKEEQESLANEKIERGKVEKEKMEQAEKAAVLETAKVNAPQTERPRNKLQKRPPPLAHPIYAIQPKEQRLGNRGTTPAPVASPKAMDVQHQDSPAEPPQNYTPQVPPFCPYPISATTTAKPEACDSMERVEIPEPKCHHIPGYYPESAPPPALPPRKDTIPTGDMDPADPAKPTDQPTRPALQTRILSTDDPKKKVSFDGKEENDPKDKDEDTIMTGMDVPPPVPGGWKDESVKVLSVVQPEAVLPGEKAPRKKKGTEPEYHQEKMDEAHWKALRVASEISKYSWPGAQDE